MAYQQIVLGTLLFATISCTAFAAQQQPALDNEQEPAPEPYSFSYSAESTGGFSTRQESGDGTGRVSGFYTILGEDGRSRRVDYVADENGYRASISTNEIGTRTGRTGDANYEVQAPSAGQLEAARVTAEEYALLERPHLQAQGIRDYSSGPDFRQDLSAINNWQSRGALLAPAVQTNARQVNFQYQAQPSEINNVNRQTVNDAAQEQQQQPQRQQQQQQWRQPRSENVIKSQFMRSLGAINGPEQINNNNDQQQQQQQQLVTINPQQTSKLRQVIQPNNILQKQMERQFMLQATQLTQQDYPRREIDAGQQEEQQQPNWRQRERERQQVVELSLPVNQQQQSNIINEIVDQQNEGELNSATEQPLIPQPIKVLTNTEQSSSSTSLQDENNFKPTERPIQSTSVATSTSTTNTVVEQPTSVASSSYANGNSNLANNVDIQQEQQNQQVSSSSQASNFQTEPTTRAPMVWRPLAAVQQAQEQSIKQSEGARQSNSWLSGVVMRVTSTSTSRPTTEEPEVAVVTTASAPVFRVTQAPELATTVQPAILPVKQQEVALSSVSSTSGNKWTQYGQQQQQQQQQIEKRPNWQQGVKGSKAVSQQSWIQSPFRKPQIQLQQQPQQPQQISLGVEYLNSTPAPAPTTSSIFINENQPNIQSSTGQKQQQQVVANQTKWTQGGTKGGSRSSGNRFWKNQQRSRLSEASNNQGSFGSTFGSRLNVENSSTL